MRKILFTICLLLITVFIFPAVDSNAKSNTLGGLRKDLKELEVKYANAEAKKAKTQSEINAAKNNVYKAKIEIDENQKLNDQARIDIELSNIEISKTEESIKDLMRNYQLTNSGNVSLEYIFNAESYADLIYRYAVAKQIADYSGNKLDDYEEQIKKNEQLRIDLENREKELEKLIETLNSNLIVLGNDLKMVDEAAIDIKTDIKSMKELIKALEALGCKEDEDMEVCMAVNGSAYFTKPLNSGTITSNFGYRKNPVTGAVNSFHSGIDIGGNPEGTNVYAVASGTVGKILYKQSCGGNMVYIYHTVGGKKYTSTSMHLLDVKVKLGQKVTTATVIGTVGGGKKTSSWERCSTGAHLHLSIATGWYGTTCSSGCYTLYSTYSANLTDPRPLFNFPALNGKFTSR